MKDNNNNVDATASAPVRDSISPISVVELLECKDCGHMVPAQNMAIHGLRACQPRKQPAQKTNQQEDELQHQLPLTEPLLPDRVTVSPAAPVPPMYNDTAPMADLITQQDGMVVLPPPTPANLPNVNSNVPADAGSDLPVTTADAVVPSPDYPINNLWKKITDTWQRWTSGGDIPHENSTSSFSTFPARREGQQGRNNNPTGASSSNNDHIIPGVEGAVHPANRKNNTADTWTCPRCTLDNVLTRTKCEACMYRNPEVVQRDPSDRPSTQSNHDNNNNRRMSPANYLSGGAILGGVLGAVGATLTGQNPVIGLMEGAMNGAFTGAVVGSAIQTRGQIEEQQQRMAASPGGGSVRVIRRQMPNGTVTVLVRPGGHGRIAVRQLPTNHDPLAAAMMESLIMAGPQARGIGNPSVEGMSYEQLLEAFGTGGENLGADQEQIRALPSSKVEDPNHLPEDCRKCPICLESFCKGSMRKTLPCLHGFHEKCVDQWLKTNAACPICKHRIDE